MKKNIYRIEARKKTGSPSTLPIAVARNIADIYLSAVDRYTSI